ncbi:hypothetical protein AF72_02260 [Xylella taiwanensis]|nr:hypothetical protein AB672_09140 [Xylella taiwanensis]EWS79073.1 hypothetical protein AF72_02260 [Xylella taiwanensis]
MTVLLHTSIAHLSGNLTGLVMFGPCIARAISMTCVHSTGELTNGAAVVLIDWPVIGASAVVFALDEGWLALFLHDCTAFAS